MDDDKKDGKPYISSVFGAVNMDDDKFVYRDLFKETLSIPRGKKSKIIVSAVGADEGTEYYLTQDKNNKLPSKTGIFEMDDFFAHFSTTKKIYAYIRKADGTTSELEEVNIDKGFANAVINKLIHSNSVSLVGKEGQELSIGDDIPILGGLTVNFGGMSVPIGVDIEGNRVRISFGRDIFKGNYSDGKKSKESAWQLLKKQTKTFDDIIDDKLDTLEKYTNSINNAKGKGKDCFSNKSIDWTVDFMGYLEGTIVDNTLVVTDASVSGKGAVGFDYVKRFYTKPTYLKIKVKGEAGINVNRVRLSEDIEVPLEWDCELRMKPSVEVSYNAGIEKIVSAGVYGRVALPFVNNFSDKYRKLDLEGELGLRGELFLFESEKTLLKGKWTIVDHYYGKAVNTAIGTQQFASGDTQSGMEYDVASRDYLNTTSEFDGTMIDSSGEVGFKTKELQNSIYSNGQCQLVKFGDKMMMVWIEDFRERDTYNRYRLVYSVYNSEDNAWTQPKAVSDNGKMDSNPVLVSDGQKVYVAWQNVNKVIDENDMESYTNVLNNTEIMYAEYDAENDIFVNITQATHNNVYDYNPRIDIIDGKRTLYWIESASDTYEKSSFTIRKMNEEKGVESVYEGLNYVLDMECKEGEIAYIMDEDGDLDTCDDLTVYTDGNKVHSGDRAIMNCQYGTLEGKKVLFYSDGINVFYMSDGNTTKVFDDDVSIDSDFEVINNGDDTKILWYTNSDTGTELYTSNYESGKWTAPVKISDMTSNIKAIDVLSYNGQIYGIFDKTERSKTTDSEGREIYKDGLTDMCQFVLTDFSKLSADVFFIDDAQLIAGENTSFDVFMENAGSERIEKIKFTITDSTGGEEIVEKDVNLESGESKNVNVSYTLPENIENSKVSIVAAAIDESGNEGVKDSAEYDIGKCDMLLKQLNVDEVEDYYVISGVVSNDSGVKAENVFLHILPDSMENGKLETLEIGNMESHTDYSFSYMYDKSQVQFDEEGCCKFYLNVATASDENMTDNNRQVVLVTKEKEKTDSKNEIELEKDTTTEVDAEDTTTVAKDTTTVTESVTTSETTTQETASVTMEKATTLEQTTSVNNVATEQATTQQVTTVNRETNTEIITSVSSETTKETLATKPELTSATKPTKPEETTVPVPTTEQDTTIYDPTTEGTTAEQLTTKEEITEKKTTETVEISEEETTEKETSAENISTALEEPTSKLVTKKSQKLSVITSYTKEYGANAFKVKAKLVRGNGKLIYSASDKKVAIISSSGKVTLKGTGVCIITIQAKETATYKKTAAKITITVKPKKNQIAKLSVLNDKSLNVTWKKDTKAKGYEIQYSTAKSFRTKGTGLVNIKKNTITSYKLKKLTKDKKYYVRVRAYQDVKIGGKTKRLYGSYSSVKLSGKIK